MAARKLPLLEPRTPNPRKRVPGTHPLFTFHCAPGTFAHTLPADETTDEGERCDDGEMRDAGWA